jgi:trimeric autotransporter adhesin
VGDERDRLQRGQRRDGGERSDRQRHLQQLDLRQPGLAIDLVSDGVTGNDSGDRDGGPNGLQNFPVLSSARRSGSTTTIRGGINSNPNTQLTVQFFASSSSEASGHGEGKRLLGKVQVQTDGRGSAGLSFTTKSAPAGSVVTATATRGWYQRASGSTSEVSRALPVR